MANIKTKFEKSNFKDKVFKLARVQLTHEKKKLEGSWFETKI